MIKRASAVFAAAMLALTGCSGEDGDPGTKGTDGTSGTSCTVTNNGDGTSSIACEDGTSATVSNGQDGQNGQDGTDGINAQNCSLMSNPDGTRTLSCPDGTTVILDAVTLAGKVAVSNVVATNDGADAVVTYNVKLNGVNNNAFTVKTSSYRYANGTLGPARTSIATTGFTVASTGNGNYSARITGAAATTPTTFMIRVSAGTGAPAATIIAHNPAGKPKSTVSDQACINCHGNNVFASGEHHGANPQGVGACVVCHTRADSSETRLGTATNLTTGVVGTAPGTRLMGYVHGIHNSHNMADGVYSRNGSTSASSQFSIGFPSYMQNCSTCHDTAENLALVMDKPVSFQTCVSCHDGMNGFAFASATAAPFKAAHLTYTAATNCAACHDGGIAPAKVSGFHGKAQKYTERTGLLYDGKDQSMEFGKRVSMSVDSVAYDAAGTSLVVTWSAKLDGAAVDPCNADFAAGPVFLGATADTCAAGVTPCNATTNLSGRSASNMAFLQGYATGNDWTNEGIGSSPGQPVSTNVTVGATGNTTCAANVATTTIAVAANAPTSGKGVLGLQGKPQVKFTSTTAAGAPYERIIQVRSPSPTREFVVGTGAEPTEKRRAIVDSASCLTCHQGSMYQHGGNRVDSVDLCVICHNPASNEKNVRVGLGVDASEAYDGQPGQTYDFRYMLHAIHSAGRTNAPLLYYRSNGIYAFGSQAAIDALPNWPGTGSQVIYGSTAGTLRTHNEIVVHYPRPLTDCGACHVDKAGNKVALPSTTKAVAVTTYDSGASNPVQTDDVLMSPATASCMSCHQSGDVATQSALRAHAFQNSWIPAVFTAGRQGILAGGAAESCLLCHGDGRDASYNAKHAGAVGGGH